MRSYDLKILFVSVAILIIRIALAPSIVRYRPDVGGGVYLALTRFPDNPVWTAPYGLLWYGISESFFRIWPTPLGYVISSAVIDSIVIFLIRNHRIVLLSYSIVSWFEFISVPVNMPVLWMSLLGIWNPWLCFLGLATKIPDFPSQIHYVIFGSLNENQQSFWAIFGQYLFYGMLAIPSISILIEKRRGRRKTTSPLEVRESNPRIDHSDLCRDG